MTARIRITYVGGSSTIADDSRAQTTGGNCTGSELARYAFHTLSPGTATSSEVDDQLVGALSWRWDVTGRTASGSQHIRIELSSNGNFTDTVLLADQVVLYTTGTSTRLCFDWAPTVGLPCQYGTRSKAGSAIQAFIDNSFLSVILAPLGLLDLVPAFAGFIGGVYLIEDVCSRLPPTAPPVGLDIWFRSAQTLKELLDAAAWPHFCECSPGTPAPIAPPPPAITLPPGLAVPPTPTCDPLDLCAAIIQILETQGRLEQTVSNLYQLVTTQQRYGLPFSYVRGRSFSNQTGAGTIQIQRLVGVLVVVDQRPAGLQTFGGAPEYISDLGWVSALTGDGLIDEIRLTRDVQSWFSKLLPSATSFGWFLREGVTASFTELLAEP